MYGLYETDGSGGLAYTVQMYVKSALLIKTWEREHKIRIKKHGRGSVVEKGEGA